MASKPEIPPVTCSVLLVYYCLEIPILVILILAFLIPAILIPAILIPVILILAILILAILILAILRAPHSKESVLELRFFGHSQAALVQIQIPEEILFILTATQEAYSHTSDRPLRLRRFLHQQYFMEIPVGTLALLRIPVRHQLRFLFRL